jgi:hypothetical protein
VGVVVATMAFVPSSSQQWMCEAVVGEVRPPNVTFTCSVLAVGSRNTVANPAPGVVTAGTSFAPERLVVNVIGIAWAAGADSVSVAIIINAGDKYRIPPSLS